jgi:hypothetical protein
MTHHCAAPNDAREDTVYHLCSQGFAIMRGQTMETLYHEEEHTMKTLLLPGMKKPATL